MPATAATSASPLLAALLRHYDQLVAHARRHFSRFGGDTTAAPDVVHDVCVQLIERPPAQPVNTPLAFLHSVTTRRAIDRHRVEAGRAQWVEVMADPTLLEPAGAEQRALDPRLILQGRQQLQVLAAAIEALPPRCREVFVMFKIHELPQAEIARHLGISAKTVEKHLRLGVDACRQAMDWEAR